MTVGDVPPFVDVAWLLAHREAVVADVRWYLDGRDGRAAHADGHVPGAVFVDLDTVLAGPPSARAGRHPLPTPEDFAAALGRLGVGDDDVVVAYDDAGGAIAARLVWMLRAIGQPAAVLDGGVEAWPGPLEAGTVARTPVPRTPRPWPAERLVDADAVAALAAHPRGRVLDARAPERFRGDTEPVDARPGHVPGAVNAPFAANLRDGRLRPLDELARLHADALDPAVDVAAYCGSGVTACHDLLVLEQLGRTGRLYPGSWSQWSHDETREAVTGDR